MSRGTLNFAHYTVAPGSSVLRPIPAEDFSGVGTGPWAPGNQIIGAADVEVARVKNGAPASTDYGLITRAMLFDDAGNPVSSVQPTYHAVVRLAARPYALSATTVANTRKQYATLHHAATATKILRLRRVLIALESVSVAGFYLFDLHRITTAPATGNPAITPTAAHASDAAAEATCLALPTTAGTEGGLIASREWNLGVTGTASVVNPPPPVEWYELWSEDEQSPMGEQKPLTVPAGTLGGWGVTLDPSAAGVVKAFVKFVFTEK